MSLKTPEMIRQLQKKLYVKAKTEPAFRFYQLYDKMYRADILTHAYALARANGGAPGVDGVRFEDIESNGLGEWLAGLGKELHDKTYKPQPVRRVMIPKPGGGERPLGIPTIRDRVAQTAAKLVMEPIVEADLEDSAHGYRPKRDAIGAVKVVHGALCAGYTDVVDADLSKYFDTIPHRELMQTLARRIVDKHMLKLLKMWMKTPVEEKDENGKRHVTGGKQSQCGSPQGGVVSPMLANLYMNRFLKAWRMWGLGEKLQAKLINYADDFVILSRGKAQEALDWTRKVMSGLKLKLNETKTCIRNGREEHFNFLGYAFGPERYRKDGHWYLGAKPSPKSVQRCKDRINEMLEPSNMLPWDEVARRLNRVLEGWSNYFRYGTRLMAYRAIDNHVYEAVRHFLKRRHKVSSRGTEQFPDDVVFGVLGVKRLRRKHLGPQS